ncbi:MAG: hypothetical protein JNK12_02490 [Acidimicrobiales bacterium]|nr:hypothetical protein [Acidimicrobiales bacterium]
MDDPRIEAGRLEDSTRWLLVVLVGACVLAAGVLAVSDVAGLVGRRWQVVGAASATLTVLALVVGLLAVLRAMGPGGDDEPPAGAVSESPAAADPPALSSPAGETTAADIDIAVTADDGEVDPEDQGPSTSTDAEEAAVTVDPGPEPLVLPPSAPGSEARRAHRAAVRRYHRARSIVTVSVVLAVLGMAGMATAAVVDGNNVEDRARRQLEAQLTAEEDGPITEPQAVAVQLTTPGLRRVAEAMGCTGSAIGARPVQGWAVSGTYRNPTVVLFAPVPACDNIEIALAPRDGFVYPTLQTPTSAARPAAATPTTAAGAGQGAGGGQGQGQGQAAATPAQAAPAQAAPAPPTSAPG